MRSPAGGQEGHRTPERPHRPGAAHRGKVHHVYSPFTEFVNTELPPLNEKKNSDQYSSYNGPDMSSPNPLQMSPLSIRADRDGDPNAGPSGSNLSDLQGSYGMQFPFSPQSAGHPALPPSEQGPSRSVTRWQSSSQRTSHTPNLSYPWSPMNFGCQTLSPGCPTLSIHDPVDFPLAPPEQPQDGPIQGSPDKPQQGPGDAMVWTPGDITTVPQKPCANPVAVEFLGRQASRSEHAEPDNGPSGLSTDIHPLIKWGLQELAQPAAANCIPGFNLQGPAVLGLQGVGAQRQSLIFEAASQGGVPQDLAVQQRVSQPAPEQQSAILTPSSGQTCAVNAPGGLGIIHSDRDANGGTLGLGGQHRPASSQLSTYSTTIPGAFPAVYQPTSNGVATYPTADTSGASPSALMPVMRPSEAVVGSFSPEFVPNVYSHSSPPGMTPSLSVIPPQTPGDDKSASLTSISTWTRRSTLASAGRWAKRCNCKKSKCLKLYCDCFAAGEYCGACTCQNCQNSAEHKELVEQTRESISQRNPQAFVEKISNVTTAAGHRRGCNCKKSNCKKKYCECYQAGVNCGQQCKCEACQNTPSDGLPPRRGDDAQRQRIKAQTVQIQEQPKTSPGTPTATVSVPPPMAGLCPDSRGTLSEQRVSARNKARRAAVGPSEPGGPGMHSSCGAGIGANPLFHLPDGVVRTVPEELHKHVRLADASRSPPAWQPDALARATNAAIAADLVHVSHRPSSANVLQPMPGNVQPMSDPSRPPLLYTLPLQVTSTAATPPSQAGTTMDLQSIFAGSQMLMNNQQWYQQLLQQGRARQAGQACSPSLALPMQHGPSPQGIPSGISAPSPTAGASGKRPLARPTVWTEQHTEEDLAGQGVAGLVPLVFNDGLLFDDDPACASNFMESVPNSPYFERENRSGLANLLPEPASEPLTDVQELEANARETAERLWGTSLAMGIFTKRPGASIDLKSPNKGGRKLRAKMQMVEVQSTTAANTSGAPS